METENLEKWIDFFKKIDVPTNNFVFVISALIIFGILLIRAYSTHKKEKTKEINILEVFLKSLLSIFIGWLFLLLMGTSYIFLLLFSFISPFLGEFVYYKYFCFDKDEEKEEKKDDSKPPNTNININVNSNDDENDEEDNERKKIYTANSELVDTKYLKDLDPCNIIDVLIMYGYISHNQRIKLYERSILLTRDINESVKDLLVMEILTQEEYEEALAICSLNKLYGIRLTYEEAIKELAKIKGR